MKTFRYPKGNEALTTVTVGELLEVLSGFPKDMPMLATWEGIRTAISKDVFVDSYHFGYEADKCDCLIIDVNDY